MIRSASLPAAVLLGLTLIPPTAAQAAGETCRGQAATHVGAPGVVLTGTEGPDVVVTNGSESVDALGGDDLVCITGAGSPVVHAGGGNDVVDATAHAGGATTVLGAGDDTYDGSAAQETVTAGAAPSDDTGRDVIRTGPRGLVRDVVHSGQPGQPNSDDVRGGHLDLEWHGSATGAGVLDGGADSLLRVQPESWGMSLYTDPRGVLASTGWQTDQAITGFTDFEVTSHPGLTHFTFRGSRLDESLFFDGLRRTTLFQVSMSGGDDDLTVVSDEKTKDNASMSGGRGSDHIRLGMARVRDVDLDLRKGRLSTGRGKGEATIAARGFEHATVVATDVELLGTAGRNDLAVNACRATVQGLGAGDDISAIDASADLETVSCGSKPRMRFLGGPGKDTLVGSNGPDLLVGGAGRDLADGRGGRDTCQAEKRTSCEVRR